MSSMEEETHFVQQQGIGESNKSLLRDHNGETSKVKLKACKVILTDIFGVDRSVYARNTYVSRGCATANDLHVCSRNNTMVSPQKVRVAILKNIDKEETTESPVKLPGTRDCTHSDETNNDRPKVNKTEKVFGCRIKVKQEKVADGVSKSDDEEEETRSIGQQGTVQSHQHNVETSKVKLKACSVVLTDIFKVSRTVCAKKAKHI